MNSDVEYYPLTYPQQSIWFLEKLNPGTGIGNIAATMKVDELLDRELMNRAVNLLLKRNDGFRIRFNEQNGKPLQYVTAYQEYRMEYFDFSRDNREVLYSWDHKQTRIPFELLDLDMFYFAFLKIDENSSGIFARVHHLISDAWSLAQLGTEIMQYYQLLKTDQPLPPENNPSYLEFVKSEQAYLQSDKYERDQAFWKSQYERIPELTTLKSKATNRMGLNAKRKSFIIPERLAHKMARHCSENRTSMFALFFSALCIYINRVKDINDITIGTPVLNRTNAREKKTIGMFISTVPIRIAIDGELNFVDFSKMVDRMWLSVLKHQKYPYDHLVKDVRERNHEVDKLFDIAISYQNAKLVKDENQASHESRWHFNEYQVESLYLHINEREADGKIVLNYDFLTDHFFVKEIEFIHDHIIRLLWHALDNPAKKLAHIHMLSEKEMNKVLVSFNDCPATYPQNTTVARLFEEQVEKDPEALALVLGHDTMSYGELNEKANMLARILRRKGVGPEIIVGMLVPRSLEMIVGILAIVKAGGAYLPMDPDYPKARVDFMLEDSKTRFLLSRSDLSADLHFDGEVLDIFQLSVPEDQETDVGNLVHLNHSKDLLYVIYTSGSTGRPKGAMIEHRNVVRLLFNSKMQFAFGQDDCWTLFHSYCFDFSVWEMYGALLYGGRLIIIPKDVAQDTDRFLDVLKKEKVTVLNQTPGAFYNLVDADSKRVNQSLSLRYVIFGGEALKPIMLWPFRIRHPETKLINMYGITETTVHVTYLELSNEDIESNVCNIGRPIPTTKTYILDGKQNPLPIGVPGEICVSGDGVGRGYLNNKSLTDEKFVPNPYVPGEILYRSGDLARFYAQGDMEYLGRIDNQIKIRGHRIELGEIESAMLLFDKIKEVVVITRDSNNGSKQMCSYFIPHADFEISELRSFLTRYLPEYMIPAYFIKVEKIPLNGNGKIDRMKLPLPGQASIAPDTFVEAQNEDQENIAHIWQEALGINKVGINDNFFQLGGDSLSAMAVVALMGKHVTFSDLYGNPTIKSLSETLALKGTDSVNGRLLMKLSGNAKRTHVNILCFPYGGGTGAIYKDLADSVQKIAGHYSVYAVQLPGHDAGEGPGLRLNREIMLKLIDEIKSTLSGEIILYGHCVGSALTIETAKQLRQENIDIKAIFLGGIMPPATAHRFGRDYDPWKMVSDRIIMRFLGVIGLPKMKIQKEYLDIMIRSFRHDARNYYRFFYDYEILYSEKLDTPIHCIVGEKDPVTRNYKKKYKQWSQYSQSVELSVIKDAKHYFIKTNSDELAMILTEPD